MLSDYVDQILQNSRKQNGIPLEYVNKASAPVHTQGAPVRVVAFYLPQFHPIAENNKWWGTGFTEWTNVSKAAPQYLGHYQPHLPGELGFYDLRLVEVMRQQAELAKLYGVGGFCFHYYWFGGKRLLEQPINQYLQEKSIDFPFCFCWANENWTRRWDGQENDILIAQKHSKEDDIAFIEDLIPAFRDPRYIRVNGKPVLIVYRVSLLPDPAKTAERWRKRCRDAGIGEIYLVVARSFEITDPRPYGFDASVEFPPHQIPAARINNQVQIVNPDYAGNIYSYTDLARGYVNQKVSGYPLIKTVSPSWDNEARKPGAGHVFHGASPAAYAEWLHGAYSYAVERIQADPAAPDLLFVNAWNEWAEGAHLEPDRKFGYAYLHATANVILRHIVPDKRVSKLVSGTQVKRERTKNCALIMHVYYEETLPEIIEFAKKSANSCDIFISVRRDVSAAVVSKILKNFPSATIFIFDNVGRDILPFLKLLEIVQERGYEFVCKVHSKRSPQRADGDSLRTHFLRTLLGSEAVIQNVLGIFERDKKIGVVTPHSTLLDASQPDRNVLNRPWLKKLMPRFGRADLLQQFNFHFPAGSMYWARTEALRPLLELKLQTSDFEPESGQYDGTLAHAIERLVSVAAEKAGYKTIELQTPQGDDHDRD